MISFQSPEELSQQISRHYENFKSGDDASNVVLLVGSALTASTDGKGVATVNSMVELACTALPEEDQAKVKKLSGSEAYQKAFDLLGKLYGPWIVNQIIRKGVLKAYNRGISEFEEALLESWQYDVDNWHLSEGVEAIAHLLTYYPDFFSNLIFTTNFDPLIEIAIESNYGRATSTVLDADGVWKYAFGRAVNVVHLHGNWIYSKTLHTLKQLTMERKLLKGAIKKFLKNRTLIVMGYGGWPDIMMASLKELIIEDPYCVKVMWCFYGNDEKLLLLNNQHLFNLFQPLYEIGAVSYFKGVNLHESLQAIKADFYKAEPSQEVINYLNFSQRILHDRIRFKSAKEKLDVSKYIDEYLGEMTKVLCKYDRRYPLVAALTSVVFVHDLFEYYRQEETLSVVMEIEKILNDLENRKCYIRAQPLKKYHANATERQKAFYMSFEYLELAHDEYFEQSANNNPQTFSLSVHCARCVFSAYRALNNEHTILWWKINEGLANFINRQSGRA